MAGTAVCGTAGAKEKEEEEWEGFRVLNIGFQLINWAENGAGERARAQRQVESGSITSEADVSLAAIGGIETSIVALNNQRG